MGRFPPAAAFGARARERPMRLLLLALIPLVACSTPSTAVSPQAPMSPPPSKAAAPDAGTTPAYAHTATRSEPVVDTLFGKKVADPYRWLEDEKSAEVQAWMAAADTNARAFLDVLPGRAALVKRLESLLYVGAIGVPTERGTRLFYMKRSAEQEKAVLCWRPREGGAEKVLLDPNGWDGGKTSLGVWVPSWDGKRLAYSQRPNNADEAVLHVIDVDSGKVSTVDILEGAKYAGPSWTPNGRGFYYEYLPNPAGTAVADRPGLTEIRYHTLGKPQSTDTAVYGATHDATSFLGQQLSRDGKVLLVYVTHGWTHNDVYMKRLGKDRDFQPLVVGQQSLYSVDVWKGHLYVLTDEGAPRKRLFRASLERPARNSWLEIVPEDAAATLQSTSIVAGLISLDYLKAATSELRLVTLLGKPVRTVALPELGSASNLSGQEDRKVAYYSFTSFTRAFEVYRTDVRSGATTLWARVDVPVDASRYTSDQVRYRSKDGTEVSMFIVRKKDVPRDGTAPALLYGYGGFDVSMTPTWLRALIPWLDAGGVYALTNLRGGGEYGKAWHEAGMRKSKQNVFDDFVAAAEALGKERWADPRRIAIYGGSNGGLLVGAAMVQRPDLFAAVVCAVPLLDMVRYTQFGSGRTWADEYGDPSVESDFAWLLAYSPYHHVVAGTRYPPLLLLSSDHDDRVDPMHARKFAALIEASSASHEPVLLRIERNAGHGGADQIKQTVAQSADTLAFLFLELGLPPPTAP
jgi:prolyl oligopeptidase